MFSWSLNYSKPCYIGLFGCFLIIQGWLMSFMGAYYSGLIYFTIIAALAYLWLQFSQKCSALVEDNEEISNTLPAYVYLLNAFAFLIGVYYLYSYADSDNLVDVVGPFLVMMGALMTMSRFIINSILSWPERPAKSERKTKADDADTDAEEATAEVESKSSSRKRKKAPDEDNKNEDDASDKSTN